MKNLSNKKIIKILLAITGVLFIWAMAATLLIFKNPVVIVTHMPETPDNQKVHFLTTFIQNYFAYSADTLNTHYSRNQPFLSQALKDNLLEELIKKQSELQSIQIDQKVKVLALHALSETQYESDIEITSQRTPSLLLKAKIDLSAVSPSTENPAGILVNNISASPLQNAPVAVRVAPHRSLTIEIPCTFKSSNLQDAVVTQKNNIAQLEWTAKAELPPKIEVWCQNTIFEIETHNASNGVTLFLSLLPHQGEKIKRSRDQYEKTIEKVLGISLE